MERQRVQLGSSANEGSFTAADVTRARGNWSLVTEALLSLLNLSRGLTDATRIRILQPLQNAEAKLTLRRKSGEAESDEPEDEPTPDPTPEN